MNKDQQNLVWACLPKEVREELRAEYQNAIEGSELESFLQDFFGHHNLTSDTEPEEMLCVSVPKVVERIRYLNGLPNEYSVKEGIARAYELLSFFGDKCLPDNTSAKEAITVNEDNFAKSDTSHKSDLSENTRKNMQSKTTQTEDIIFQDNNCTAKAYVCFCDGELCVSVVAGENQYDFGLGPLILRMLAYGYKLHCERYGKEITPSNP